MKMLLLIDHVASLCKTHFLQQLYRKIDGAVVRSQNEPNLDCVITFQVHSTPYLLLENYNFNLLIFFQIFICNRQTETILQRFMLRFEQLQLDCNDHLYIYDGAHAIGNGYKVYNNLYIA